MSTTQALSRTIRDLVTLFILIGAIKQVEINVRISNNSLNITIRVGNTIHNPITYAHLIKLSSSTIWEIYTLDQRTSIHYINTLYQMTSILYINTLYQVTSIIYINTLHQYIISHYVTSDINNLHKYITSIHNITLYHK